jgi:hypothetical protein
VTPTHDAYLENGTDIGLTVGKSMIAYVISDVNIPKEVEKIYAHFGNSKMYFRIPASFRFFISLA